jgi:hypothetical protein
MLISLVIITMATAILYPALQGYQETEMEHRVAVKMAEIESAAISVHRHPGSSRTVIIDVPSSGGIRLDSMIIGGDLTAPLAEVGTIRWHLSSGPEGTELVGSPSAPVPMADDKGEEVVLDRFPSIIVLEARTAPSGSLYGAYVQVTTV